MNNAMPKVRKRLIVEGNVQGVGYRVLVSLHAKGLKLKGLVRNLPDESVEIICEGEPGSIAEFLKSIDIKGDPADRTTLNVASIREVPFPPSGELKRFHVDYGKELTDLERDAYDRDEIMVYKAVVLNTNVNNVGKDVRDMHTDMNTRFDHMAGRYDLIAVSLTKAIEHLDRTENVSEKSP